MSPLRALILILALSGCATVGEKGSMAWFSTWPASGGEALDPKVRAVLDAQGPVADFRGLPLDKVRSQFNETAAKLPKLHEPLATVETLTLPEGFRVRLYVPAGKGPFPALLYLHGGGWVLGDLESHDDVCRSLARRTPAVVVSVDYRLSPESKFPGPLDDSAAGLKWLIAHASELKADPARVAVGGDSAGGQLAASLAIRMRDERGPRIGFQLLIYPATDRNAGTGSLHEFASGVGLTLNNMAWFWDCYLRGGADDLNPQACPLRARDLSNLPPAFVLTAGHDVLRDEGEAYAKRLHEAGIPVRCVRYSAMNHGFLRMGAVYPHADRALTDLAEALRAGLR